ncbi:hypothetical protein PP939_gp132 [Rhizobium phage RL38J1]|uniref:Uncharacterized protein n=1 Tax=Rhizobium phage RL38J1 TaxID=2663232 RepID=A0A6B9JCN9_9CAUD|nr:hypothetical protein PP939_gp132 [Rhizobium phage RL38J1]QGZ13916.1 hypothetical protein RL38J1_132 [Rhizobium phage RL38J1]
MSSNKFLSFSRETVPVELPTHREWFNYFGPKSCAMVAIALSTGLPKEFIYQQASLEITPSRWQSTGTPLHVIRKILNRLRVTYIHHADKLTVRYERKFVDDGYCKFWTMVPKYLTETQFKNSHLCDKTKTYLVCNHDHAWVIKNGVTLDPIWYVSNKQTSKRRIEDVIEIRM